jgi:hypothetical protein
MAFLQYPSPAFAGLGDLCCRTQGSAFGFTLGFIPSPVFAGWVQCSARVCELQSAGAALTIEPAAIHC